MARPRVYALVGLNLLVLPGLGTFLAGRRISGMLQIALAVAGFLLSGRGVLQLINFRLTPDGFPDLDAIPLRALAISCGWMLAAWLWSLVSSLQILRAARKTKL
jgi:hypothetical protein